MGKGWTPVIGIKQGDQLKTSDSSTVTVDAVEDTHTNQAVYTFTVNSNHDYYVKINNVWVLVHNNNCKNYEEVPYHTYDRPGKTPIPDDAEEAFKNSIEIPNGQGQPVRWAKVGNGKKAVYYRYFYDNQGRYHFSGSTSSPKGKDYIPEDQVPIEIKRK